MPVQKPYFNLHQIITGQYTSGNEFVLEDGTNYVGEYHILPTLQKFTGSRPFQNSKLLLEKRFDISNDSLRYNQIKDLKTSQYIIPILYYPNPTIDDYKIGEIERFFVQKRNSPTNTIIEIDGQQFNSINRKNQIGINGIIWNKLYLKWKISRISKEDIAYLNLRSLQMAEPNFAGIGKYINNLLEFYK